MLLQKRQGRDQTMSERSVVGEKYADAAGDDVEGELWIERSTRMISP